ncbi:hypothetical protein A2125_02175 [Candidatus Woesebacteria bacterium GWB1_43_5]|uniref:Protein kinase domain-containing protein n=1 Tax=Candidatus Woesebacteria bacterium GWB1_43_5 TaxID=1802474 RepID=A0A1F7WTL7_9BACT|nr:MAG: hypothetical protein A2125_02175 [Candidatus Woesebacteria bacterium GWB1_43_5]
MSEVPNIEPEEYSVDPRQSALEASESRLYRGVDKTGRVVALKFYVNMPIGKILEYQKITNQLAINHNYKKEFIELEVSGQFYKFLLYIVPIEKAGIAAELPCTISPFIEGPTLFDLEPHYVSSRHASLPQNPLVKLGAKLREETGTNNISLIPWNVKPLMHRKTPVLAITDIAGAVNGFKIAHKFV